MFQNKIKRSTSVLIIIWLAIVGFLTVSVVGGLIFCGWGEATLVCKYHSFYTVWQIITCIFIVIAFLSLVINLFKQFLNKKLAFLIFIVSLVLFIPLFVTSSLGYNALLTQTGKAFRNPSVCKFVFRNQYTSAGDQKQCEYNVQISTGDSAYCTTSSFHEVNRACKQYYDICSSISDVKKKHRCKLDAFDYDITNPESVYRQQ